VPSLVSVVVRSVDRPELAEALASIGRQTHPKVEAVVVDAVGSHRPVPACAGPHPVRLAGCGEPLRRSRAANLGLAEARGRYVVFLDDDDIFLPEHVSRLVAAVEAHPCARAAFAGVSVEGTDGTIDTYDADFDPVRLIAWNHLPTASVLLERSLVGEGLAFDETLDLYEDWDFWLQVASRTTFARAPGVSAIFRPQLGRSGMIDATHAEELAAARHAVWGKWLPRLPAGDFERLIAGFREEIAARDAELASAAFSVNDLWTQHHALQDVIKGERTDRLAWRREARAAKRGLRCEVSAREAAVQAAQRHTAALEQALAEMRASTSWRLTAPLRGVAKLLRRGTAPAE
jgi:glycosyltransferase involved in cell wall biosynthesis